MASRRGALAPAAVLAAWMVAGCATSSSTTTTDTSGAGASTGAAASSAPLPSAAAATPSAVSYTQLQAQVGQQVFNTICSACHGLAEFRGQLFRQTWMARPIGDFYQHISTAMPQDQPGSLRPEQYLAVVAYVLQLNGHPAGQRELPSDPAALGALAWPR